MAEHPIHNLMKISMENIKQMVDVDTIVGNPVKTDQEKRLSLFLKSVLDLQRVVVSLNQNIK